MLGSIVCTDLLVVLTRRFILVIVTVIHFYLLSQNKDSIIRLVLIVFANTSLGFSGLSVGLPKVTLQTSTKMQYYCNILLKYDYNFVCIANIEEIMVFLCRFL